MANFPADSFLVEAMKKNPVELIAKIFEDFTFKELCELKLVSKFFQDFITSHRFAMSYSSQTTVKSNKMKLVLATSTLRILTISNPNDERPSYEMRPLEILNDEDLPLPLVSNSTQIVGSFNGLLCFYTPKNVYFVINPTTRESMVLPDPEISPRRRDHRLSGFAYDSEHETFMVVSASVHRDGCFNSKVKVYSAKTRSWKTIEHPLRPPLHVRHPHQSVFVNGVCHWLGWIFSPEADAFNEDEDYKAVYKILGFSFATEEFTTFPVHEDTNESTVRDLGVLDGRLCVLSREPEWSVGMWVMKEYGNAKSWIKIFTFKRSYISNPHLTMYPICNAGDRIWFEINHHLYLYDLVRDIAAKQHAVELSKLWSKEGKPQIAWYEETLVSPYFPKRRTADNNIANNIAEETGE